MNETGWYRAKKAINATKGAIEGIRTQNAIIGVGEIIPQEWFGHIHYLELQMLIAPYPDGLDVVEPYTPDDDEYNFLYTLFPGAIPSGAVFSVHEDAPTRRKDKWLRVHVIPVKGGLETRAFNGLAALCDIAGVCKAGEVAAPGDIVPAAWFSGLNNLAFNRLAHEEYVRTVKPSPTETNILQAKYPGSKEDYRVKKTTKKKKSIEEAE